MKSSAFPCLCLALLLSSFASPAAFAANDADVRASVHGAATEQTIVVLLLSPLATEWRARAWGQLSDLPVVLVSERSPIGSAKSAAQTLAQLAESRGADVVAWLSIDAPGDADPSDTAATTRIVIYEARDQRLHERPVGDAWSGLHAGDRSAALEVAALTLRSVLRARLAVETERPGTTKPPRARRFRSSVGMSWQLDGQTSLGALSLGADLGVAGQYWSLSLGGQWGLGASIAAREATLRLVRHALFLEARYLPLQAGPIDLGGLFRGGLAITRRETVAASELAVPLRDSTLTSALLGVGAVARWRPARDHALEVVVAANGYTAPPLYVFQLVDTESRREYPLWKLQPSGALGWAVTF